MNTYLKITSIFFFALLMVGCATPPRYNQCPVPANYNHAERQHEDDLRQQGFKQRFVQPPGSPYEIDKHGRKVPKKGALVNKDRYGYDYRSAHEWLTSPQQNGDWYIDERGYKVPIGGAPMSFRSVRLPQDSWRSSHSYNYDTGLYFSWNGHRYYRGEGEIYVLNPLDDCWVFLDYYDYRPYRGFRNYGYHDGYYYRQGIRINLGVRAHKTFGSGKHGRKRGKNTRSRRDH